MKLKILTTLLMLSIAVLVLADGGKTTKNNVATTLSGVVIDSQSGEVLTGVKVHIPELNMDAYTDFDGKFEFSVKNGENYTIEASYVSYQDKSLSAEAAPKSKVKVKLESIND